MSIVPFPRPFVPTDPGLEALELQDVCARPSVPADEPLGSGVTWRDVDAMAAHDAARPAGYVDAICLGCGVALFVPANERAGDVLCNGCTAAGNELAAADDGGGGGDDDGPDRPSGGARESENWPAYVAGLRSDTIIECIAMVDEGAPGRTWSKLLGIETADQRDRFLAAAANEILRRTERLAA